MASYQPPPTYADVILVDPENKKPAKFNPIWLNWFLGLTQKLTPGGAGSGTVTDVSVITANGLAGSVANSATTPAITLSTTITGLLKGNGTAISAASSGTDYAPPTSGTSILYGNGSGGFSNVTIGTGVSFAAGTLSATGSGGTVTSVTGVAPVASSGGTTPAISMAAATTSVSGYLTSTDWTTFNNKQASGSYLTTVTSDAPLTGSGTSGSHLSIPAATTSVSGYLTSTDWTTFNNKGSGTVTSVAAITLGTTGTDLSSTVANGTTTPVITLQVPTASASNRGALSAADWTTFNSKGSGTVTSVTGSAPVVSSGGTTPAISMAAATTSVNGYLTSTDWTTFNNKGSGTVTSVSGTAGRVSSTGGTTPVIDLVSGIASAGTTGSASLIPVVTIDTYGRVTSITTAANPQGTVTSVGGTGTVNGLSLSGTVTSSGNLTLGGTLDLSSPPAIGGTSAASGKFTTLGVTGLITSTLTSGEVMKIGSTTSGTGIIYMDMFNTSGGLYLGIEGSAGGSLWTNIPAYATGLGGRNGGGGISFSANAITQHMLLTTTGLAITGTLSATGTITPSQTAGIVGTTTTNDAQAGSVGETVMSSSALTNYPATGTWGDLTSISLTAGDWDIAAVTQQTTPGTMTGETRIGISTTSGNSATGLTIGYNRLTFPNATVAADSGASIPMYRLQLGSTTTVYLKFFTEYSTGTPKAVGTIIARRRR